MASSTPAKICVVVDIREGAARLSGVVDFGSHMSRILRHRKNLLLFDQVHETTGLMLISIYLTQYIIITYMFVYLYVVVDIKLIVSAGDYAYNYAVNINYMTPNSNVIETLRTAFRPAASFRPASQRRFLGSSRRSNSRIITLKWTRLWNSR